MENLVWSISCIKYTVVWVRSSEKRKSIHVRPLLLSFTRPRIRCYARVITMTQEKIARQIHQVKSIGRITRLWPKTGQHLLFRLVASRNPLGKSNTSCSQWKKCLSILPPPHQAGDRGVHQERGWFHNIRCFSGSRLGIQPESIMIVVSDRTLWRRYLGDSSPTMTDRKRSSKTRTRWLDNIYSLAWSVTLGNPVRISDGGYCWRTLRQGFLRTLHPRPFQE